MMTVEEKPDVTYSDIGGCKEQIERMREVGTHLDSVRIVLPLSQSCQDYAASKMCIVYIVCQLQASQWARKEEDIGCQKKPLRRV